MDYTATGAKFEVQRRKSFEVWRKEKDNHLGPAALLSFLNEYFGIKSPEEEVRKLLIKKLGVLTKKFIVKWKASNYSEHNMLYKYGDWLDKNINFGELSAFKQCSNDNENISRLGRPQIAFSEASEKTKRRKIKHLENPCNELSFATRLSLRKEGRRDAAGVIKIITENSPGRATKLKNAEKKQPKTPIKVNVNKALASFITNILTKASYKNIKKETMEHNADIYPSYDSLLMAKRNCYPDDICVDDISVTIRLQSVLDHTVKRIFESIHQNVTEVINTCHKNLNYEIQYKWGCDGSSGYSRYNQKFSTFDDTKDDSFLFVVSFVPLIISSIDTKSILWNNPSPSSTMFCRPVIIIFKKETPDLIKEEIKSVQDQILSLTPTTIINVEISISVYHIMHLTMVDGKICSVINEKSSATCYICGARPSEMNDFSLAEKRCISDEAISLGISSMHAWIRCLEFILHLSYKLDVKLWRVNESSKSAVTQRKLQVQALIKEKINLLVDIPKPYYGTTNCRNTARRFFADPKLAAEITGVNDDLIFRLSIILKVISCGLQINANSFKMYCLETAKLYVELYEWYFMPVTIHKILFHGEEIIKKSILPIGQMSEEALEARHKDTKRFRTNHCRKSSREKTMEDLIHNLLVTSDPLISSMRYTGNNNKIPLPVEAMNLLEDTSIIGSIDSMSSDEDGSISLESDEDGSDSLEHETASSDNVSEGEL